MKVISISIAFILLFVLCVDFVFSTTGFDPKNFKTCNEHAFCSNLRSGKIQKSANYAIQNGKYEIVQGHILRFILESRNDYLLSRIEGENEEISPSITNVDEGQKTLNDYISKDNNGNYVYPKQLFQNINVEISYFDSGIFRVQMKEDGNIFKKPVDDVLVVKPVENVLKVEENQDSLIVRAEGNGNVYLRVHKNDYRIELIQDEDISAILNHDSFLYIDSHAAERQLREVVGNLFNGKTGDYDHSSVFSERKGGASAFDIVFPNAKHVYGIPERATDLSLRNTINGEPYRLFNADVFRFELNNPLGLYGSIPFMFSLGSATKSAGIFALNPSNSFIDVEKTSTNVATHWMHEAGLLDVFLIPGPTPKEVLKNYIKLTGTPMLPQKFSLSYHQCRWNYKDEDDVFQVNDNFNKYNIPYDVLWLDIEHTDGKKYFTWDKSTFPTPLKMQKNLKDNGRKLVTISDPHIKVEKDYYVFDEAEKMDYFVKNKFGSRFEGDCWPGKSSWLDFFNPAVREWYASLFSFDKYEGSSEILYTWIDMNEPSVFNSPEITMPPDNIHFGDKTHREVHNMYGFYQGVAANLGHQKRRNHQDRPFILTRSFFAGSQRYVSAWTGDNTASWDHLKKSTAMLLSVSMSGFPHIGADIGGFFDNPDIELLVRWYQSGAFYPFFRGHAHIETSRREIWLFGDEPLKQMRDAIIRRYVLLPYYYTLAFEASITGLPVMRPLFLEYPHDEKIQSEENQFLIGQNLMISPVTEKGIKEINVYFPENTEWYEWKDGTEISIPSSRIKTVSTPLNYIPIYQRGGSIIPTQERVRRSSLQMRHDPYTLRIALSKLNEATGSLYLDDGSSYNYKQGKYLIRNFLVRDTDTGFVILNMKGSMSHPEAEPEDSYAHAIHNTVERIVISGVQNKPSKIYLAKKLLDATLVDVNLLLEFNFDASSKVLTIKKTSVPIGEDWEIYIENK